MKGIFKLLILLDLLSTSVFAQIEHVSDKNEAEGWNAILTGKFNQALSSVPKGSFTHSRLNEIASLKNSGDVNITFFKGGNSRGMHNGGNDCDCSTIYLNVDYFDTGPISTLVHEFEHAKHHMLLGYKFFAHNPGIDELTDMFGAYYYGGDESIKNNPKFLDALYVGSAFLFYTEYKSFRAQVDAINDGVKDTVRPERTAEEIVETVANDYLINYGIGVDADYVVALAQLAETATPKDFILTVAHNQQFKAYFKSLQK